MTELRRQRPGEKRLRLLAVLVLLAVFAAELVYSVRQQSPTIDEANHIYAGYAGWTQKDFGLNPEHPPLVKAIAALPLLSMGLKSPAENRASAYFKAAGYLDGRDFLFGNGGAAEAQRILFRARMAAALFSLLAALAVYLAAEEIFGPWAGLLALALFVFEPNLVAHGAYVTTDMAAAGLLFAAIYLLYRYVQAPSWARTLLFGAGLGLALAAKHSALLLLPIALVLLLGEARQLRSTAGLGKVLRHGLATAAVACVLLWASYGFRYAARPAGMALTPTLTEAVQGLKGVEPQVYLAAARWHLLPESYLFGLVDIRALSTTAAPATFLLGRIYPQGTWSYFPVVLAIKCTVGFLALLALGLFAAAKGWPRRTLWFLLFPPVFYFLMAVSGGLDLGVRHMLPVLPFLIVLIAGGTLALVQRGKGWRWAAATLLAMHIVSSLAALPDSLSYANELWGGPQQSYRLLADSNTDWGQQLVAVKQRLDARGGGECWFAYFAEPMIDYRAYGIPCHPLPTANFGAEVPPTVQGTVLISASTLAGFEFGSSVLNPYRTFQSQTPTETIRHGVLLYHGTFDVHLLAALGHVRRAIALGRSGQIPAGLEEARAAVRLAPEMLQAELALGELARASGQTEEARSAYQKALDLAREMEPEAAAEWAPRIASSLESVAAAGQAVPRQEVPH